MFTKRRTGTTLAAPWFGREVLRTAEQNKAVELFTSLPMRSRSDSSKTTRARSTRELVCGPAPARTVRLLSGAIATGGPQSLRSRLRIERALLHAPPLFASPVRFHANSQRAMFAVLRVGHAPPARAVSIAIPFAIPSSLPFAVLSSTPFVPLRVSGLGAAQILVRRAIVRRLLRRTQRLYIAGHGHFLHQFSESARSNNITEQPQIR